MCKKKSKKKKSTCHRCGKKTFRIFEEYEVIGRFDFGQYRNARTGVSISPFTPGRAPLITTDYFRSQRLISALDGYRARGRPVSRHQGCHCRLRERPVTVTLPRCKRNMRRSPDPKR